MCSVYLIIQQAFNVFLCDPFYKNTQRFATLRCRPTEHTTQFPALLSTDSQNLKLFQADCE